MRAQLQSVQTSVHLISFFFLQHAPMALLGRVINNLLKLISNDKFCKSRFSWMWIITSEDNCMIEILL